MTDPIDQIFNGTPEALDEDDLAQMQAAQEQRAADALVGVAEEEESEATPSTSTSPTAKAEEPKEEKKEKPTPMSVEDIMAGKEVDFTEGIVSGPIDFGVDLINLIPGANLPKLPKYENKTAQAVRDISGIVLPNIALSATGIGAIGNLGKVKNSKFLADPFIKWLGRSGFVAGVGAGVDYTSSTSKEGDNLSGTLKKLFPRTFDWIPDNIATLDSDSPDVKRNKTITEGAGLGAFGDLLGGFATLIKNAQGIRAATKWIPQSETAKNWFAKNADEVTDNVEEIVSKSAGKRSDDLDSLGAYNFSKAQNLDEPVFGIHDMYGYEEMGIRSADDLGIVGASVDLVRIQNNYESVYGRLGSVITEPAMKYALEGAEEYTAVMRGLRETLSEADQYGYKLNNGTVIDSQTIQEAGQQLAKDMGYMTNDELESILKRYQTGVDPDTGAPMLSSVAAQAVKRQLNVAMREFGGVADAYVRTSLAGQVADLATAARYAEGTAAVPRTQEQILDRIEILMVANGETGKQRGFLLKMMDYLRRGGRSLTPAELRQRGADITKQLQAEAKQTVDVLRELKEKDPQMLDLLLLAYENTDGSVRSVDALNNLIRQSTGVLRKAIVDLQPGIPSVTMKAFWASTFNSVLSAFATPIKAAASTAFNLLEKPSNLFVGALLNGDLKTFRRGMYQYSALGDNLQRSAKYMGRTFTRSGIDPNYQGVLGRESMIQQDQGTIEVLNQFADLQASRGNYGPQAYMIQYEAMNDLANHPWLRFGNRAMQATDGFSMAWLANVEAAGKAFDAVDMGRFDEDAINIAREAAYKELWTRDEQGREIISNKAVKYANGEVALNLDTAANDALSSVIRSVPALKPFLMFTKTPIAGFKLFGSYNPVGAFIDQVNAFSEPFHKVPADKARKLLEERGVPFDEFKEAKYNEIRAELKGRKAKGVIATSLGAYLFLGNNMTGNGIADRQKQRGRRSYDWKPRSIRMPGGKWVSYDNLGPITDWLALTADIMDNFDVLQENDFANLLSSMGFVLSASITDKSMLAGIEPLYDILAGNPAAINRWAASFLPGATMPGSSQMAELTRLMAPNLRVVEENLAAMIANRTPLKAALPEEYDWIDGTKVGMPEDIWTRLYNTYSPWKINGKRSDVKQFLIDIEYDHRPSMENDGKGTKLTLQEKAEVYRIMGRDGLFKQAVQRIMRTADGKKFREAFRAAQAAGRQPELKDFTYIHDYLTRELNLAKEAAIAEIDAANNYSITNRKAEENIRTESNKLRTVEQILEETQPR